MLIEIQGLSMLSSMLAWVSALQPIHAALLNPVLRYKNPRVQNSNVSDQRNSMTSVAYIDHSCNTTQKVSCVLLIFFTCAIFKPARHNATYSMVNNKREQWDVGLLCEEKPVQPDSVFHPLHQYIGCSMEIAFCP